MCSLVDNQNSNCKRYYLLSSEQCSALRIQFNCPTLTLGHIIMLFSQRCSLRDIPSTTDGTAAWRDEPVRVCTRAGV